MGWEESYKKMMQSAPASYSDQTTDTFDRKIFNFRCGNYSTDIPIFHYDTNKYIYDFIKTYLYALYKKRLISDKIKINIFLTIASNFYPIMLPISTSYGEDGLYQIENITILAEVIYNDMKFNLSATSFPQGIDGVMHYQISVAGESSGSIETKQLCEVIITESIRNSIYKNKILRIIKDNNRNIEDINYLNLEITEIEQNSVEDVFITKEIKDELEKFIYCVKNHDKLNIPLRYLLSGAPGTGKTMIIRSIANACKNNATIILASGGDDRINLIFAFANLFKPCIICLDDIDFMTENRNYRRSISLCDFLQQMDGFIRKNVFVIATTNDKNLVDYAASRPGRFDMILDIGYLDPKSYLDLIKKHTSDEQIISSFNDHVMETLEAKQINGSFLVNLIKQLSIKKEILKGQKGLDTQELIAFINSLYKGFYKEYKYESIGFGVEEN